MRVSVSLLSRPILAPLQLQFWAQARNKPVNLFQSPGQGKASQRESAIMATAPTTAITLLGSILPIHVSPHSPTVTDTSPLILHPDPPAPHAHTPLIHFMLLTYILPPLCTPALEKLSVQVSTHPLPTLHPPPPPHAFFHTQVPACLPSTLSTL